MLFLHNKGMRGSDRSDSASTLMTTMVFWEIPMERVQVRGVARHPTKSREREHILVT